MRARALGLLIVIALTMAQRASADGDVVVLVTAADSPIESISSLDIRKIYLGITVSIEGSPVRALRRKDDARLKQIFLQSVIAMSERSYERRLLSLVLKFGTPRPVEVSSRDEMLQMLINDRTAIAYMWKNSAEADSRVKVIKVLWQET